MASSAIIRRRRLFSSVSFSPAALFSGGEGGAWYEAFDIDTLFQESTGETPVSAAGQPVGLMYDKSQGAPELGPELVTNGTFDTDVSGWTGVNATLAAVGGQLEVTDAGGYASARQVIATEVGSAYLITLDIFTASPINIDIYNGSDFSATAPDISVGSSTSAGTGKTFYFVAQAATSTLSIRGNQINGAVYTFDNVSVRELAGNHALQSTAAARPTYQTAPDRLTMDKVDDVLVATLPAITGTMVLSTPEGTAAYGVNISAGSYDIGGRNGDYFPGSALVGQVIRDGAMTQNEIDQTIAYFRANGGGTDYGSVTDFYLFWFNWSELTEFPLIDTSIGTRFQGAWLNCSSLTSFPLLDTSSGTNFEAAWQGCSSLTSFPLLDTSSGVDFFKAWRDCSSLTSFPLIDTSSGTNFVEAWRNCSSLTSFPLINTSSGTNFNVAWQGCSSLTSFPALDVSSGTSFIATWRNCSSLTTFPANMFDSVTATDFTDAFTNTNLSQTSIDNILVSINTANTSNGTFDQSGGSAPSATGEAAIDALRGRGWTVTVTGGY